MKLKFALKSDKGITRDNNEDSGLILAGYTGVPATFIIADGMGGHNSGEVASKMAVEAVSRFLLEREGLYETEETVGEAVREAMLEANKVVYAESKQEGSNSGMGTTLIVAAAFNRRLLIGHVGDSRAYMARDGLLKRVTVDHSYVEELVRNGSLTREEAQNHPGRNLITRALGCSEDIEIDLYYCDMNDGDCFLLCTDGLTNMLGEAEILDLLNGSDNPQAVCDELVKRANERGGEDNITVIVIRN